MELLIEVPEKMIPGHLKVVRAPPSGVLDRPVVDDPLPGMFFGSGHSGTLGSPGKKEIQDIDYEIQ